MTKLKLFYDAENAGVIIHLCNFCGRRGPWNGEWSWYGSYQDEDNGTIVKWCGQCGARSTNDAKTLMKEIETKGP